MAGDEGGRPILTGLAALVGVGLVVGALLSVAALAGASILGFGGDNGEGEGSGRETLFIPDPSPTDPQTGPLVTLEPGESTPTPQQEETTEPEEEDDGITLQVSPKSVGPMERIDLSGTYPEGDGAILQVQRRQGGGGWEDFPVDASVNNGRFQTWIQTGRPGRNDLRMRDNSSGETSNVVSVTIE